MLVEYALHVRAVTSEDDADISVIEMQAIPAIRHHLDHDVPVDTLHVIHMFL